MAEEALACLNKLVEELPGGALGDIKVLVERLDQAELVWRTEKCSAIDFPLR